MTTSAPATRRENVALNLLRPPGNRAAARSFWLTAAGILIVWALHNVLLGPWEQRSLVASVREPVLLVARVFAWLLPIGFYLRRYDPRPPLQALAMTTRVRWPGLFVGSLPAIGYLGLITLLLQSTAEAGTGQTLFSTLWQVHALYILVLIAFEEVLMRGFLLGQIVRFTSSVRAQACVAFLFVVMHWPSWIVFNGWHWEGGS